MAIGQDSIGDGSVENLFHADGVLFAESVRISMTAMQNLDNAGVCEQIVETTGRVLGKDRRSQVGVKDE